MAQGTELRDHAIPRSEPPLEAGVLAPLRGKIRDLAARCVLWSSERGSWQYDLIVLVILAFIFLTPRAWFEDRPTLQLTELRRQQGVVEVSHSKDEWRYMLDARLVESWAPGRPEEAIQGILRAHLKGPFEVKSIVLVRDKSNVILGYTVVIAR